MKKSRFFALIAGTVSGVCFALGVCMVLLPEWGAFKPGLLLGCAGLLFGGITFLVWRKMEHKGPIRISVKEALTLLMGAAGALTLGVGMCFSMVWGRMATGILIGLVGILALLCLIPLVKGIQE